MTEIQLLDSIRLGLLKALARALASGTATHQEQAIAKALLRDNNSKVDPTVGEEEADEGRAADMPKGRQRVPRNYGEGTG